MKVVYFPSMCHIFQISLGRQENSLLNGFKFLLSCNHNSIPSFYIKILKSWEMNYIVYMDIIIQQIVTLSKYGHDALDICHP